MTGFVAGLIFLQRQDVSCAILGQMLNLYVKFVQIIKLVKAPVT